MAIELFTCPELSDEEYAMDVRDGAFGYNYQYLGNTRQDSSRLEGKKPRWDNFPVGRHRIRAASSTVLAADSRGAGPRHGKHSFTLDPPRLAVEERAMRFGPVLASEDYSYDGDYLPENMKAELVDVYAYSPMEPRHKNRGNVLFVDSHAEAMTLKELGYGFESNGGGKPDGIRRGAPIPILDPESGTYAASNKMWNGQGIDRIAEEHRPAIPDPDP
jgi:prepilin-type processing-associated H-X9-DG protein